VAGGGARQLPEVANAMTKHKRKRLAKELAKAIVKRCAAVRARRAREAIQPTRAANESTTPAAYTALEMVTLIAGWNLASARLIASAGLDVAEAAARFRDALRRVQ